jgi:hypothetical protein
LYLSRPKSASFSSESEFSGRGATEVSKQARTKDTYNILVFVISLPTKLEIYYLQYNYILIYIIYGDRTIIGFVGFVANLLNKRTDGATVSVRKNASEKELFFVLL